MVHIFNGDNHDTIENFGYASVLHGGEDSDFLSSSQAVVMYGDAGMDALSLGGRSLQIGAAGTGVDIFQIRYRTDQTVECRILDFNFSDRDTWQVSSNLNINICTRIFFEPTQIS